MSLRDQLRLSGPRAASMLFLALLAGCAAQKDAPRGEAPGCAVARVGDDVVTVGDAEIVRAAVQPPLTRDEAKRLAVVATAVYRRQHPQGALAGMAARLAVYRKTARDDTAAGSPPIEPGECRDGRSAL